VAIAAKFEHRSVHPSLFVGPPGHVNSSGEAGTVAQCSVTALSCPPKTRHKLTVLSLQPATQSTTPIRTLFLPQDRGATQPRPNLSIHPVPPVLPSLTHNPKAKRNKRHKSATTMAAPGFQSTPPPGPNAMVYDPNQGQSDGTRGAFGQQQQQPYGPAQGYGPPQGQGYGNGYGQQGYPQQQQQQPPNVVYERESGGGSGRGICEGLLAGLACCCCLDCLF